MTKKDLNQNAKFNQELIDAIEPDFFFGDKPINRFNVTQNKNGAVNGNKVNQLSDLKKQMD